jgi:hypothetical protein
MRICLVLTLLLLAACSQPGFIQTDGPAPPPPPPLLPIDELLAATSPTLTAEAAEILAARGAELKSKTGS